MTRRVSLVIYNPRIPAEGGRSLVDTLGWNDPNRLADALVADLRDVSHGYANFEIVERLHLDAFPLKADGFRYTGATFLRAWQARRGFHLPDDVNYHAILSDNDLAPRINTGQIDEVWTFSFPYAGFYESRMAGPGAFWCNAPPLEGSGAQRRFVIMAFNYERGVGEMLESFGHRAESILMRLFSDIPGPTNLWKRFTLYDQIAPGRAEVGNIHFAPNSRSDYDWGNPTPVLSRCRTWRHYPDLSGEPVWVTCREWGNGDVRAHHRWWFSLLPHVSGEVAGYPNNWWAPVLDPNRVQ